MTWSPGHRLDRPQQRRQVQPLDEGPDQTHSVILRQQPVQADRSPFHLVALGTAKTGQPARSAGACSGRAANNTASPADAMAHPSPEPRTADSIDPVLI